MRSALTAAAALTALALLGACDTARELEASRVDGCSDCHGFPPAQLAGSGLPHPSDATCVSCHSTTVTAENGLVEDGTHFDGKVDLAGHAVPFAGHSAAALADLPSCAVCHGADYGGGPARSCTACHQERLGVADWRTNCTFCHGQRDESWAGDLAAAAPPQTVTGSGGQTSANPKVGAHQAHLTGGTWSAPVACASCHAVPEQTFPQSLEHVTGRAEIALDALARQGVADPRYANGSCSVYCHGSTSLLAGGTNPDPAWTSSGAVVCGSCHTLEPQSGYHALHLAQAVACGKCHAGYSDGSMDPINDPTAVNLATHVNGEFEATIEASAVTSAATFSSWPLACSACHPSGPPAF